MNYAIHLSTFTKTWSDDLVPLIKRAADIGYGAVELPLLDLELIDVSAIQKALRENNVQALCSTGMNKEEDISSLDSCICAAGLKRLFKCIDIAYQLDCRQLTGVIYAPWGFLQSKEDGKQNIEQCVTSLQTVADYAKQRDVTLGLEILNRYEGYIINTVEEGLAFLKRIDRSNVGLHFDTFHAHIEEKDMYQALMAAKDKLVHVHFCENTRGTPGTGQVHWDKVSKALNEMGYDRWVSIENFVNANCEVGKGTMIWRQIEKDGNTAAVNGYRNMREILER